VLHCLLLYHSLVSITHLERTRMLVPTILSYSAVFHLCSIASLCPPLYPSLLCFFFSCRYIVRANEKQAVFKEKKQRDGVSIIAFIVTGIFGADGDEDAGRAFAVDYEAERAAAAHLNNVEGYEADGDHVAAKVGKNFVFGWRTTRYGVTPRTHGCHIYICGVRSALRPYRRSNNIGEAATHDADGGHQHRRAGQGLRQQIRDSHPRAYCVRQDAQASLPYCRRHQVARERAKLQHRYQRERAQGGQALLLPH